MTLAELQFVRSMVANGSEVSLDVWKRVLQTAIDATVQAAASHAIEHDEMCGVWLSMRCDCPAGPRCDDCLGATL